VQPFITLSIDAARPGRHRWIVVETSVKGLRGHVLRFPDSRDRRRRP
jgi:hypothetical protein